MTLHPMNFWNGPVVLALALLSALGSCATPTQAFHDSELTITSKSNPHAKVPSKGTYRWMAGSRIVRDPRLSDNMYPILFEEIERGLARRGYKLAELGFPDLYVGIVAALTDGLDDESINQAYGLTSKWLPGSLSPSEYQQGTLILDISDAKTGRSLWRGAVQSPTKFERSSEERRERIRVAIEALLARFDQLR